MLLRRIARPLLSAAFIGRGLDTLRRPADGAAAARPTAEYLHRLPNSPARGIAGNPERLALINAAVQVGAGALLAVGRMPRTASAVLATTVIPGNLGAHLFWAEDDPARRVEKRRAFLTDVSLLGGLAIAAADTAGQPSLGWRGRRAAERLTEAVSSGLLGDGSSLRNGTGELSDRLGRGLRSVAEHGRELAETAGEKGGPLLDAAVERSREVAETAREKGAELADATRQRGAELADATRQRGAELADATRQRGAEFAATHLGGAR